MPVIVPLRARSRSSPARASGRRVWPGSPSESTRPLIIPYVRSVGLRSSRRTQCSSIILRASQRRPMFAGANGGTVAPGPIVGPGVGRRLAAGEAVAPDAPARRAPCPGRAQPAGGVGARTREALIADGTGKAPWWRRRNGLVDGDPDGERDDEQQQHRQEAAGARGVPRSLRRRRPAPGRRSGGGAAIDWRWRSPSDRRRATPRGARLAALTLPPVPGAAVLAGRAADPQPARRRSAHEGGSSGSGSGARPGRAAGTRNAIPGVGSGHRCPCGRRDRRWHRREVRPELRLTFERKEPAAVDGNSPRWQRVAYPQAD